MLATTSSPPSTKGAKAPSRVINPTTPAARTTCATPHRPKADQNIPRARAYPLDAAASPAGCTAMTLAAAPSTSLSLQTYLQVIRRQRRLIILVTLLTAAFATLPALLDEPVYTSSARVQIAALDDAGVFDDQTAATLASDRARELATEIEILRSSPLRAKVVAQLPDPVPRFQAPKVEQVGLSEVVEITITADSPDTAADVANSYAEVYVEDRRARSIEALVAKSDELRGQSARASAELDAIAEQLASSQSPADVASIQLRQSSLISQVQEFDRRADELAIEATLRGRATQVISPAELQLQPISDSAVRAAVLGLALGLLLGLTIAVIVDTVQDRLGSREDLAGVRPDAPLLAAVPHANFESSGGGFAAQEAFRYLRTGLRVYGLNATLRSVLVTSAVGGEGKTTTATNLALVMADAGDRVVLVDCDLRRPSLHAQLGVPNDLGLSSVVVGDASLDEVIHFVRPNLAVVTAGPQVQNPTEMLGTAQFARVLRAVVDQADFTIVDSPPVLPVADALIAGQQLDGAVVVSRIGNVRRREVRDLLNRLEEAGIALVGLVANDLTSGAGDEYYGPEPTVEPAPASS